ncbi:ABC transporter permease [Clostridiaceae bacterium]|nr:ABC transporter permease [Lachnospiraceae bacterium]NBH16237.1 ABC transporter permease [Clostridiaceae bacterium]
MIVLLEIKERLKMFYGKFALPVDLAVKFCVSLSALILMNGNLGYLTKLKNPVMLVGLALLCSFLPYGAISFIMAAVLLGHIYSVSMEFALLTGIFLILIALLYYGLQPKDSYWLILTPVAFALRVPFVVPLLAGLSGGLSGVIPVSCGAAVYYIMIYVKQNAGVLTNDAEVDITEKYVQLIRALVTNETMMLMITACAVGILVVYLIRLLSIDYAWIIAIVFGSITQMAVVFIGDSVLNVQLSPSEMIVGTLVSLIIAGIYHFFVFAVDYSRTEYTQFEDDDYVYYVKAVPKIVVSKPDVRVQRINDPKKTRRTGQRESEARL